MGLRRTCTSAFQYLQPSQQLVFLEGHFEGSKRKWAGAFSLTVAVCLILLATDASFLVPI